MRRHFLSFLFFLSFLLLFVPKTQAQLPVQQQNILLSCLDPTNTQAEGGNGVLRDFLTELVDKNDKFKAENGPVYVLASYPVPHFKERDKEENTCERLHNGTDPGKWWFCADFMGGGTTCKDEMLMTTNPGSQLRRPKDTPSEPVDDEGEQCTRTIFEIEPAIYNASGQFTVPQAKIFTPIHNKIDFWGLQLLNTNNTGTETTTPSEAQIEAVTNALKLATFGVTPDSTPGGEITPAASNCVSISWDPHGRVIDALTLEPIEGATITLKNKNSNGDLVQSTSPMNPIFVNPQGTNGQGGFNFAVDPGIYYLFPQHTDFTFPISQELFNSAVANLNRFDPNQEYIERNRPHGKLYVSSEEPIEEFAKQAERRDIIMAPKNPNYQGSMAKIMFYGLTRSQANQYIQGTVTHPKAIIHAVIGRQEVATAVAKMDGTFTLVIPQSRIDFAAEQVSLTVEKTPLIQALSATTTLISKSPTQPVTTLNLVPSLLSGFVFDQGLKLSPYAKIDILIPSLGNISYSTTYTDRNGYLFLSEQLLPPFEFVIQVTPRQKGSQPMLITVAEFKKFNTPYLKSKGLNLYTGQTTTNISLVPSSADVTAVKRELSQTSPKSLSYFQQKEALAKKLQTPVEKTESLPVKSLWIIVFGVTIFIVTAALLTALYMHKKPPTETNLI